MERRLGRGLGALLPERVERTPDAAGLEIPLDAIRKNHFQPRTKFDPEALEQLRASIQEHGVLQPIVVVRREDGYELIAGERRWRAAGMAGLTGIPAIVREGLSDQEMLELALVENVQRKDLDPIERAIGFQRLIDELGLTQAAVSKRVGLERATVTNHLRLLDLPARIQELVTEGALSMGHARALLGLQGTRERLRLARRITKEGLSVRNVEQLARGGDPDAKLDASARRTRGTAQAGPAAGPSAGRRAPWMNKLEERLRNRFGTKALVEARTAGKGRIVIEYYSRADLDRLHQLLVPDEQI